MIPELLQACRVRHDRGQRDSWSSESCFHLTDTAKLWQRLLDIHPITVVLLSLPLAYPCANEKTVLCVDEPMVCLGKVTPLT
jgi:hypothetical protein